MMDALTFIIGWLIICLVFATITLSKVSMMWKEKCNQMQQEIDDFKQFKQEMRELNLIKELGL